MLRSEQIPPDAYVTFSLSVCFFFLGSSILLRHSAFALAPAGFRCANQITVIAVQ